MKRFLIAAAFWHVIFVLGVFAVGRAQLAPQTFDSNGIGVSFAIDSHAYRIEAADMSSLLWQGKVREWMAYKASFHVKLYSLSFAVGGPLVGKNILGAEPLNLIYYLLILALTSIIAREAFDQDVAALASLIVALWPSLLLHTTQLLRDTLFIPSVLLLALALLLIVNRTLSLKRGLLVAILGTLGAFIVWLCRGDSWEIVVAILIFGAVICVLAQLRDRRFSLGNSLAIATMLLLTASIPQVMPAYRQSTSLLVLPARQSQSSAVEAESKDKEQQPAFGWNVAARLGVLRHGFIVRYPLAGSNIDTHVELLGMPAVVRYLPRALAIGFFAPFPNMWLAPGVQVGLEGRLMAGAEMLFLYAVIILAGVALLRQPRKLSTCLLLGIAMAGCVALGYVVVNISTLYRMRYAYFILIIIIGMKGFFSLTSSGQRRRLSLPVRNDRLIQYRGNR